MTDELGSTQNWEKSEIFLIQKIEEKKTEEKWTLRITKQGFQIQNTQHDGAHPLPHLSVHQLLDND